MKLHRPGILAVRAVNQYRRRDVFAYLALRYYLANSAACSDEWAMRAATELVLTRHASPYFRAQHFKDVTEDGHIEHRAMFIPGANETLAEAALLAECAKHPKVFGNPSCVYSYDLIGGDSRSGFYSNYINGIRARHEAITRTSAEFPRGVVRYTDIKKFYPNIGVDVARKAWQKYCNLAELRSLYRRLGSRLIDDYGQAGSADNPALLTGPMFSHLLANLVFREFDEEFSTQLPARYFRYVDDITLVGEPSDVERSLETIRGRIGSTGLVLHDDSSPKNIQVSSGEWMQGSDDFRDDRRGASWMKLFRNLKQFLLLNPTQRNELQDAFRSESFRIPVRDYSTAVRETGFIEHIRRFASWNWFRRRSQSVSINSLMGQAKALRSRYDSEFRGLIDGASNLTAFAHKRRLPKLRYCASRLIYLASDDELRSLGETARQIPDLYFHSQIMMTVADGNLDRVMGMGTNAAQAAAQPLKAAGKVASTTLSSFEKTKEQSLAVFLLNGVAVQRVNPVPNSQSELIRFAASGADLSLMKSADPFLREIACLHGISEIPRHPEMFDRVFDEDEELALDAVDQLQQSVSP